MEPILFSAEEKTLLLRILEDYKSSRKRKVTDKSKIQELIDLLMEKRKHKARPAYSILKTKSQFARELGIDRKTLMDRIYAIGLAEELFEQGCNLKKTRGFFPKDIDLIKKHFGIAG